MSYDGKDRDPLSGNCSDIVVMLDVGSEMRFVTMKHDVPKALHALPYSVTPLHGPCIIRVA